VTRRGSSVTRVGAIAAVTVTLGVAFLACTARPAAAQFACPGFPGSPPGGVCTWSTTDKLHGFQWWRRSSGTYLYNGASGSGLGWTPIADIQINSTSCGIDWYHIQSHGWTWEFFSPGNRDTIVPSAKRSLLDAGIWRC